MAITESAPSPTTARGICIAFDDPWNTDNAVTGSTAATWTRIDDPDIASLTIGGVLVTSPSHVVVDWSVDRGRQYELDTTQAGTATIHIVDTSGLFDPTAAAPYSSSLGSRKRAVINAQNPQTGTYSDIFSGYVQSYTWSYADQSQSTMLIEISLVDGFDILNRTELVPDNTGSTVLVGQLVDDRINALLQDANWPTDSAGSAIPLTSINTGNVAVPGYAYNAGTSTLSAIQDAADAEFPGVANFYMDKSGNATFRGRWPRFQPGDYPNQVKQWNVGDSDYAQTNGYAFINDIQWTIDQTLLYNATLCYPYGASQYQYPTQLSADATSIAQYGARQITLNDILCNGATADPGTDHGGPYSATTGLEECFAYSDYYVNNFGYPVLRINQLTFKTVDPYGGTPQAALWELICNVEIGDVITVWTTIPGGGGMNSTTTILGDHWQGNQHFVDGIHHQVNPLNEFYPDWTMTLDLSPRVWYTTFKGVTWYQQAD